MSKHILVTILALALFVIGCGSDDYNPNHFNPDNCVSSEEAAANGFKVLGVKKVYSDVGLFTAEFSDDGVYYTIIDFKERFSKDPDQNERQVVTNFVVKMDCELMAQDPDKVTIIYTDDSKKVKTFESNSAQVVAWTLKQKETTLRLR